MEELKVVTLNTWGLLYISKDVEKRMEAIAKELSKGCFDVVALQELWSMRHYEMISEQVKETLPYSHYFRGGFTGTGCAVFSRYPILDTFFQKFLHNGYFWDVFHGDWYAGKGVGCVIIQHPKKNIHFFNTHLHANYGGMASFKECRALQIYQVTQIIKHITRPGDSIIICGDFNHEPEELGIKALTELSNLNDTYMIAKEKPEYCMTLDPVKNRYNDPMVDTVKRIDYIFTNDAFDCLSCDLTFDYIPETKIHYSDHTGYMATLRFKQLDSTNRFPYDEKLPFYTLRELWNVMKEGERLSSQIEWKSLVIIMLFLFFFVILPVFAGELFYSVFPTSDTWFGKIVFLVQVLTSAIGAVYFVGFVVIHRKLDKHAFENISATIGATLKASPRSNGNKKIE